MARRSIYFALPALLALSVLLMACEAPAAAGQGGAGGFSGEVAAQQVALAAGGGLTWQPAQLTADAGDLTFVVRNPTALDHNLHVIGNGVNAMSATLRPGTTTYLTLKDLKPGTYKYVCTLPGHEATMTGTLTVR